MITDALKTLIRVATENIEARKPEEQAAIYDALSHVLPTKEEQLAAGRVAFAIRETQQLQMEFTRLLKTETAP